MLRRFQRSREHLHLNAHADRAAARCAGVEEEDIRGEPTLVELCSKAQPTRDIFEILSVAGPGANKDRFVSNPRTYRHADRGVDTHQPPRLQAPINDVEKRQGSGSRATTHHPGLSRHTFQHVFEARLIHHAHD
ncbi:hypothetical protein KB1_10600 [Cutibacterium modestum]|uniref:Uncharacterized protein n=1 Tax=Cutibacterium modestum TaxID=2559073 RepID=A0AAD1NVG7_9ACTN|nr:hypothetical protein KB1_10600 [Cutibacterium modestum]